MPRWAQYLATAIAAVPIVCASCASVLLMAVGGFGGGHGRFDGQIYLLGLPAIAVLDSLPIPQFLERSDLLLIICYPALLNLVFVWGPLACVLLLWARFRSSQHNRAT